MTIRFIRFAIFLIVASGSTTCSLDHSHLVSFGHMKPLGSHRPPETTLVDDLQEMPSPRKFWTNYVRPSRAVVLRGAAKHSRAFTEWTDEYLREHFSDLEVRLEAKKEKSSFVPTGAKGVGRDTIGNFIEHCHKSGNNHYIVSELPTPMWPDVTIIPPMTCGLLKDRLVEVDLWMSGGGTSSILHKDAFNAINCLYNGTKEWKLVEYKYEDMIYKAWEPPQMVGGFSRINVKKVDLLKYPKVAEVPWSFVTVNAGDCLFLPKSYYHQVTSYGTNNVAVSLLFARLDEVTDIHFRGCDQPLSYQPLSEFDVDWKYPGHGNLSMGNTDLETIRDGLLQLFGENEKLDKAGLQKRLKELSEEPLVKGSYSYATHVRDMEHIEKIFEWFGFREKGFVSQDEIKNLSRDEMRKFALAFEGTDVTNTEEAEYGIVNADYLRSILTYMIEREGHIEENKFIKAYMERTGGTRSYAKNFFEKLRDVSSAPGKVTSEELKRNLDRALERYLHWQSDPEMNIPPGQESPEPNDAYMGDDESGEEDDDTNIMTTIEEAEKGNEGVKHEEL